MMVIVLRARRTPEGFGDEYQYWFKRMSEIAVTMPGYISHKGYIAEDGERLSLFEWESTAALKAWAQHPEHVPTKKLGREKFYSAYHLQVCEVVRNRNSRHPRIDRAPGRIGGAQSAIFKCQTLYDLSPARPRGAGTQRFVQITGCPLPRA